MSNDELRYELWEIQGIGYCILGQLLSHTWSVIATGFGIICITIAIGHQIEARDKRKDKK